MEEINVEEIKELQGRINEINSYNLSDIKFYENGNPVEISEQTIKDWKQVGLNNIDLITTGYYKKDK